MRRMYHDASRQLQDRFDTRRLADRLAEKLSRTAFTDEDSAFIASQAMFFLSTADEQGWPECSYKGGVPGFVRVLDAQTLAFPSYDGNGMFRSLGNVMTNPRVGLLFIDFERPRRLRVQGRATLSFDGDELASWPGAQCVVRVLRRSHLSELPALHPPHAAARDVAVRAVRQPRAAAGGVEALRDVPRRAAQG